MDSAPGPCSWLIKSRMQGKSPWERSGVGLPVALWLPRLRIGTRFRQWIWLPACPAVLPLPALLPRPPVGKQGFRTLHIREEIFRLEIGTSTNLSREAATADPVDCLLDLVWGLCGCLPSTLSGGILASFLSRCLVACGCLPLPVEVGGSQGSCRYLGEVFSSWSVLH